MSFDSLNEAFDVSSEIVSSEPEQVAIGRHLKDILDIPESEKIGYMVHDDAIRLERRAKDRYTV